MCAQEWYRNSSGGCASPRVSSFAADRRPCAMMLDDGGRAASFHLSLVLVGGGAAATRAAYQRATHWLPGRISG